MRSIRNVFSENVENNKSPDTQKSNTKIKEDENVSILQNDIKSKIKNNLDISLNKIDNDILNEINIISSLLFSEKSKLDYLELLDLYKLPPETTLEKCKDFLISKLSENNLLDYYNLIEYPSIEIIKNIKKAGVLIDKQELIKQTEYLANYIKDLEKEIHKMAGEEFLISSPKQLAVVLYDKLKIGEGTKLIKRTAKGERSTNADVLESLREENMIIEKIID